MAQRIMFPRVIWLSVLIGLWAASWAQPQSPGPAVVYVVRSDTIFVPQGLLAPRILFPEGRLDFKVIERLVDQAMTNLTGKPPEQAWQQFCRSTDKIVIIADVARYPVQVGTIEVIVDRLLNIGLSPSQIIVLGGDERDLFRAGFNINRDPATVRVLGAESEGYRDGLSRIVSQYGDVLINVASLKADPELGFAGCLANMLSAVPFVKRIELRKNPEQLPQIAAQPLVRRKLKLNLLEAYVPLLEMAEKSRITYPYKGLLASTDIVAVDVVGKRILEGCRNAYAHKEWPLPAAPDYLQSACQKYRLGQADAAQITVRLIGNTEQSFLEN